GEFIGEGKLSQESDRPDIHDFSNFLETGKNVIAVYVADEDATGGGLEAILFMKSLPGWEQRQKEIEELKQREKDNLLFDKGILPKSH
ncbi:MAG: hypothetical protein D6814_13710, partial [Calditrichaeota bacterium]